MLLLHNLEELKKKRKRVYRGGDRRGRGNNGQKARPGDSVRASFEGGQMALSRRLPKRGFTNIHKVPVHIVNVRDLERAFVEGQTVNRESLIEKGIIKGNSACKVKLLGMGTLSKKLTIHVDVCSVGAQEAVRRAGGSVIIMKKGSAGSGAIA